MAAVSVFAAFDRGDKVSIIETKLRNTNVRVLLLRLQFLALLEITASVLSSAYALTFKLNVMFLAID